VWVEQRDYQVWRDDGDRLLLLLETLWSVKCPPIPSCSVSSATLLSPVVTDFWQSVKDNGQPSDPPFNVDFMQLISSEIWEADLRRRTFRCDSIEISERPPATSRYCAIFQNQFRGHWKIILRQPGVENEI
jgi:hypothetical protein